MSNVAEAFLDGFGSLGAIFEPCERPGSTENLIEEQADSFADLQPSGLAAHGSGYLGWLFFCSVCSVLSFAVMSQISAAAWMLRVNEICLIGLWTLFLREVLVDVLLVRWRQHTSGEKAAHRA